ncbi:MAG TPA: class I SAM-dependent methyltransferase [Bacteroidales bacterium]|nr:class I SAM-dependent methyltransferase [Bacteroidales bacterium]
MNEFDLKAKDWDKNPMHMERSVAIANGIKKTIPLQHTWRAMEFGTGTALLSFLLKDYFSEILLIDTSAEMIKATKEKIAASSASNMKTMLFDLEKNELKDEKFDIIYTQMVLHHVTDIELITGRFLQMLNPGGYLAIADLYPEDGTFHDENFKGHKGIDAEKLSATIVHQGFTEISHSTCYTIKRLNENNTIKEYPVFLLTAKRK